MEKWGVLYARIALGAAFLSAVAGRFGIWAGDPGLDHFTGFTRYTAEVTSFMPAVTIPFLAWGATVAEVSLGVALIVGVRLRWVALGAALLLAVFGAAMAVSLGPKEPLDYSVFSASAAALLLAMYPARQSARQPPAPRPGPPSEPRPQPPPPRRGEGPFTGVIGLQ